MSLTLNSPTKKKFVGPLSYFKDKSPLPIIIGNQSDDVLFDNGFIVNTGRYNGITVIVDDPDEIKSLYTMGFFGKGCLSKKIPNFDGVKRGIPRIIRERQWERRKVWAKELADILPMSKNTDSESVNKDSSEPDSKKAKLDVAEKIEGVVVIGKENVSVAGEVVVIADSESEDEDYLSRLNPQLQNDSPQTVFEALYLTLEEAFFLSYGLGCLQVIDLLGNFLSIIKLWNLFRHAQKDFIELYVAYHYFRSKGWVVKPGMKFGGQFILYKKGPPFYHASYVVLVKIYDHKGKTESETSTLRLTSLNRVAESVFKEVLLCGVMRPDGVTDEELSHPNVLRRYKVQETLIRRWQPAQERETN